MYNFVCGLILSQNFLYIAHGFPGIIPFPVQLPLKLLERNLYMLQTVIKCILHALVTRACLETTEPFPEIATQAQ